MVVAILIASAVSFLGGCLVVGNNPSLYESIRKLLRK